MKISYITMQFPVPSETFASNDINMLLNLNNTVSVYCLRPKHKNFDVLIEQRHKNKNIDISHLNFINFLKGISFIFLYPFKTLKVLKWIFGTNKKNRDRIKSIILLPSIFNIFMALQRNKPDIVHLFWGHYPSILLYLLKEYMPEVSFTMFLGAHDLEIKYQGSVYMSHFAKKVFTHSFDNIETLNLMGIQRNKIEVVHRGVVVENETLDLLKDKILVNNTLIFLTASRLIKEKGVDEVIDIFTKFNQKYPFSKLYIAGDGPFRKSLEKQVQNCNQENNILFLGHISQNELFNYMNNAAFFILMSRYKAERLPNVLKEAMIRKCVCITTYTIGIEELIRNRENGFIFETKEDVLSFLLSTNFDNKGLNNLLNDAQTTILEKFNVKKIMKIYMSIWKNIIQDKRDAK